MKGMLAAAGLLAVLVGAILAYTWGSPDSGAGVRTAGVITMLAGLAVLMGVLVRTVADLRRTGRHRRPELVVESAHARHDSPVGW